MSKPLTNVDIAWLMDSIRSIPQRDHRFATAQGWYEICTGAFQWKGTWEDFARGCQVPVGSEEE